MDRFLELHVRIEKSPPATGGRVVATTSQQEYHLHHGHMAPSIRRNYLVCFYCNKKSNIKYNGLITQWECSKCDATNFLDEHGEITDPIVATEVAPPNLKYSTSRPVFSQPLEPNSDSTLFCALCLKNQHLYTASIAQYDFDPNTRRPDYHAEEREYFKWRRNLEKLYPQVCEDCEPKVLERLRETGKTAKTDHLRRLMDKSRARRARAAAESNGPSITGPIIFLARLLWYFGILGQLAWNITAIISANHYDQIKNFISTTPGSLASLLATLFSIPNSNTWAYQSLICSLASMWWCPMYRQAERGFMNHITGYRTWYQLQLLLVVVRLLFYRTMGSGVFADPFSRATLGAHVSMCTVVTLIFLLSHRTFKVDLSPLWNNTTMRLRYVGPGSESNSPAQGAGTMADILDEISTSASRETRQPSPSPQPYPSPTSPPAYSSPAHNSQVYHSQGFAPQTYTSQNNARGFSSQPYSRPQRHESTFERPFTPPERVVAALTKDRPLLSEMSVAEGTHWMSTGELPVRFHERYGRYTSYHTQDHAEDHMQEYTEEMEWTPTMPQRSLHRAFNPPRPLQREAQTFGQTPVDDQPSPFWFKVPPAPVTPAQRLRNPPNQPRLRVTSQEVKENWFSNAKPSLAMSPAKPGHIAQQRLFFPEQHSEGDNLAGLLGSFSLSERGVGAKEVRRSSHVLAYLTLTMVVGFGLVYYNWYY